MAYQADLTRVFTLMMGREGGNKTYPALGITEGHHQLSHHGGKAEQIAKHARLNQFHVEQFAKFIGKLQEAPDGDGSVLDHSLIVYGSGMSNGNVHSPDPLPLVMLGGVAGQGHRHIEAAPKTTVGNLWVSVAEKFGCRHRDDRHQHRPGRYLSARSCPCDADVLGPWSLVLGHDVGRIGRCRVPGRCGSWRSFAAGNELPLIAAVKAGDAQAVRTPVKQAGAVNAAEPDGTTALHWAVRANDLATVQLLLRAGAKANAANRYGVTPLSLAAVNGNPAMLEALLKAGADANTTLPQGETVLMRAARTGTPAAIKVLVAHGADVNRPEGIARRDGPDVGGRREQRRRRRPAARARRQRERAVAADGVPQVERGAHGQRAGVGGHAARRLDRR